MFPASWMLAFHFGADPAKDRSLFSKIWIGIVDVPIHSYFRKIRSIMNYADIGRDAFALVDDIGKGSSVRRQ